MDNINTDTISAISAVASAVAASFSAIAALCALYLSHVMRQRGADSKRADIHSRFQSEARTLLLKLSNSVNEPENWQPSAEEQRHIRMYWYLVFDEWVICNKEDPSLADLWQNYYLQGARSALRNPHFEASLKLMFDGQSAFFEQRNEFKQVINGLYAQLHSGRQLISN